MSQTDKNQTVLIAEDDEQVAYLLQFMFEREGFHVRVARDGRAVLELAKQDPIPNVLVLDVMMPFYSGFELISILRQHPGLEKVPIIMLTAKSGESNIVRALEAGASDYIVKPFHPPEVVARVRRLLRNPS